MKENKKVEELKLDDKLTTNTDKQGRGILGKLYGVVADVVNPTRNGRKYSDQLWEKVFNNPIVNEYFESGGLLGELNHPEDRLETDLEKIAVCMPEKPKKDKDGHLVATLDILDTPNGRIAYTLAKYGYKLGISSRGDGETYTDMDGNECVNEDTYRLEAWDLVLLPAVKSARLKMVESLQNGKTLTEALDEQLKRSNDDEKRIMEKTLSDLNIKYNHESVIDKKDDIAADDIGATVVKDLQEALIARQKSEAQVTELQEKLSVCYTKEAKYEEDIAKYKTAIRNLSESACNAKALQTKLNALNEDLNKKDEIIKSQQSEIEALTNKQIKVDESRHSLQESLSKRRDELKEAKDTINSLNESIKTERLNSENKIKSLNEDIATLKKDLKIKSTEYNNKLASTNTLIEKYKNTAQTAINKYINLQALKLGVKAEEIKNKLPSNYSFNDIDTICEQLSDFNLRLSDLPFDFNKQQKIVVKNVNENYLQKKDNDYDEVDDSLLALAHLK